MAAPFSGSMPPEKFSTQKKHYSVQLKTPNCWFYVISLAPAFLAMTKSQPLPGVTPVAVAKQSDQETCFMLQLQNQKGTLARTCLPFDISTPVG